MGLEWIAIGAAAVGTAATVATSEMGAAQADNNARALKQYNDAVDDANEDYRAQVLSYQNQVWAQDITYGAETLGYQEDEFAKQASGFADNSKAIQTNTDYKISTVMLGMVENAMKSVFQDQSISGKAAAARATIEASDRSVTGNSVDAIINDVTGQEGSAKAVLELSRTAAVSQAVRDAIGIKADGDTQLGQLVQGLKTYAPTTPINMPSPVSPITPQAPVAQTQGLGVGTLAGAVVAGFDDYNSLTGNKASQTLGQLSNWIKSF